MPFGLPGSQILLKPVAESSTDFFPSLKCQGIYRLCVFGGFRSHANSTYERGFRQTFAHAILEYCVRPAKQDGHERRSITSEDFCFCLAGMAHLCTRGVY